MPEASHEIAVGGASPFNGSLEKGAAEKCLQVFAFAL